MRGRHHRGQVGGDQQRPGGAHRHGDGEHLFPRGDDPDGRDPHRLQRRQSVRRRSRHRDPGERQVADDHRGQRHPRRPAQQRRDQRSRRPDQRRDTDDEQVLGPAVRGPERQPGDHHQAGDDDGVHDPRQRGDRCPHSGAPDAVALTVGRAGRIGPSTDPADAQDVSAHAARIRCITAGRSASAGRVATSTPPSAARPTDADAMRTHRQYPDPGGKVVPARLITAASGTDPVINIATEAFGTAAAAARLDRNRPASSAARTPANPSSNRWPGAGRHDPRADTHRHRPLLADRLYAE